MPPQQQQSMAAAMLGQIGTLTGLSAGSLGMKNPNDLYVGMLKSRTVADALIERFSLKELYDEDTLVETRKELASNSSLTGGKDGLIIIEVEDENPQRAADMANSYVDQLTKLTQNLAISEASQRRLFFEQQLLNAKDGLAKSEVELRKTQERTGMIAVDEQGKATIEAAAMLRAQVTAKEVEMAAMRSFATDSNPDYRKAQEELTGLRTQLAKMERNSERDIGDILISTGKIPSAGLEYARKLRDVKYYETIFELMAKQFELAKLDEARDATSIQVIDKAVPEDKKSKPKRALIVVLVTLLTGLISGSIALTMEHLGVTSFSSALGRFKR
jgi:capsule polysaccharide export protein KpsE/RkpR